MNRFITAGLLVIVAGVADAQPAPGVTVGPPIKRTMPRSSEQPGHIEAYAQTALVPKLAGYVKAIHKDIGDVVRLAHLPSTPLKMHYVHCLRIYCSTVLGPRGSVNGSALTPAGAGRSAP